MDRPSPGLDLARPSAIVAPLTTFQREMRSMYKTIYVPVDNSDHSNACIRIAVDLADKVKASIVGSHVYAARMHDYRFKQMEYTLPEEYKDETELERQRKIHDSLITMGLRMISDSYLDVLEAECGQRGIPFEAKTFDGKHHVEIRKDIRASKYDLVVMGAIGVGAVRQSLMGSSGGRSLLPLLSNGGLNGPVS